MDKKKSVRIAVGYLVGAAITIEVAGAIASAVPLPAWWYPLTLTAVVVGFPLARALGWMQA